LSCNWDKFWRNICICSVDCLVAVGKKSSVLHTTEKFYERLRDSRNNPQKMVNSPLLIADNIGDVLGEAVRDKKQNFPINFSFFSSSLMFWLNRCNSFYKALVYVCIYSIDFHNLILFFFSFSIWFTNGSRFSGFRSSISCDVNGRCWSSKTKFCTYIIIWYSFTTSSRFTAQISFINIVSNHLHTHIYITNSFFLFFFFFFSLITLFSSTSSNANLWHISVQIKECCFGTFYSWSISFVLCSSILLYLCVFVKWIYVIMYDYTYNFIWMTTKFLFSFFVCLYTAVYSFLFLS
jgi:hypothetical protein